MKSLKKNAILTLLTLSAIAVCASCLTSKVKEVKAEEVTTTDYSLFKIRGGNTGSVAANSDNTGIVYTGGWDSNFAVTDQFDTRAGNYSLKTHVYKSDWAISDDMGTGFTIYYNDTNFITFYLKWNNSECATSITEGTWLNHINGAYENAYQSAILPNGAFETRGNFTSVWSDGQWTKTLDGESINLRTESIILINKGFDMTLHVERSTYLDRLVDIIYVQIDALALDGTTPLTAYSPRYAVDAMTAPLGVKSNMADRKPQIGFMQFNMSNITYSNIVFTDKTNSSITSEIITTGTKAESYNVVDNNLEYKNNNFASGFVMPDLEVTSNGAFNLEASISGTDVNTSDTAIGFAYYFNDSNYAIMYLQWDASLSTISGLAFYFVVDGKTTNVTSYARDPWESTYATFGDFYVAWSDWQGWITDSPEPMGQYNNFNTLRNESAITISSGFTMSLERTRAHYANRLADSFQVCVTAKGTDGHIHNWYSPTVYFDAFTYPNGSETASPYINVAPQVGFYGYNLSNNVNIKNVKFNNTKLNLSNKAKSFAEAFNSAKEEICDPNGVTTDKDKLVAKWNECATYYASLSESAKNILNGTTYKNDADIITFQNNYDTVLRLRGTSWGLSDFMSRGVASQKSNITAFSEINNNTITIVSIISIIAIASIGALLILKRKREE